jgi:hypothetical protein
MSDSDNLSGGPGNTSGTLHENSPTMQRQQRLTLEDLAFNDHGARASFNASHPSTSSLALQTGHSSSMWGAGTSERGSFGGHSSAGNHTQNRTIHGSEAVLNGSTGNVGSQGSGSGESAGSGKMSKEELRAWKAEQAEKARRKMQDLEEKLKTLKVVSRMMPVLLCLCVSCVCVCSCTSNRCVCVFSFFSCICIYIYIYIYIYTQMYMYVYTHIHARTHRGT